MKGENCGAAFKQNDRGQLRRYSVFDLDERRIPVGRYVCRPCRMLWFAQHRPPETAKQSPQSRRGRGRVVQAALF